jgi:CRISPR/Cas system-associated protein Cas7 (RAMP superfamily)
MTVAIIDTLKIYENLSQRFEKEEAKAIIEAIEEALEVYREHEKEFLVTKEEFKEEMAKVNQRITDEVAKLDNKISETKADLMKWMFIFIFGQYWLIVGTLTGILFAFFKR